MCGIQLNAKLRVLMYTLEHLNEVRLHGAVRQLVDEVEHLQNWLSSIQGSDGLLHPRRYDELKHYGVIYRTNIVEHSQKVIMLLKQHEQLCGLTNVKYIIECLNSTDWLDMAIGQYVSPTDLHSMEKYTTMYALSVTGELVTVSSLAECEDRALSSRDPIYEVTCRLSNYRLEDGRFVISIRDVAESKRYR